MTFMQEQRWQQSVIMIFNIRHVVRSAFSSITGYFASNIHAAGEPDWWHTLTAHGQLVGEHQQCLADLDAKVNLLGSHHNHSTLMSSRWCHDWASSHMTQCKGSLLQCKEWSGRRLCTSWTSSLTKYWNGPQLYESKEVSKPPSMASSLNCFSMCSITHVRERRLESSFSPYPKVHEGWQNTPSSFACLRLAADGTTDLTTSLGNAPSTSSP